MLTPSLPLHFLIFSCFIPTPQTLLTAHSKSRRVPCVCDHPCHPCHPCHLTVIHNLSQTLAPGHYTGGVSFSLWPDGGCTNCIDAQNEHAPQINRNEKNTQYGCAEKPMSALCIFSYRVSFLSRFLRSIYFTVSKKFRGI
jgi:hypothetical protein